MWRKTIYYWEIHALISYPHHLASFLLLPLFHVIGWLSSSEVFIFSRVVTWGNDPSSTGPCSRGRQWRGRVVASSSSKSQGKKPIRYPSLKSRSWRNDILCFLTFLQVSSPSSPLPMHNIQRHWLNVLFQATPFSVVSSYRAERQACTVYNHEVNTPFLLASIPYIDCDEEEDLPSPTENIMVRTRFDINYICRSIGDGVSFIWIKNHSYQIKIISK